MLGLGVGLWLGNYSCLIRTRLLSSVMFRVGREYFNVNDPVTELGDGYG